MEWTAQAIVAGVAVAATLLLYFASRSADRKVRRAELVRAYTADFYDSPELTALFFDIDALAVGAEKTVEWGRPSDGRFGGERESALIHLLDYLNTVGSAYARGAIPIEDLAGTTIGYMTFRTWHDETVQQYLAHVRSSDAASGYRGAGFQHVYSLAAALDGWSRARGGAPWSFPEILHTGWRTALERGRRRPRDAQNLLS